VTEQLALDELTLTRVQVVELKLPVRLLEKLTVPFGVTALPELVSVTVAVQVVTCPVDREVGTHETVVEVFLITSIFTALDADEFPSTPAAIAVSVLLPAGNEAVVRLQNPVVFAVVVATASFPL